LGILVFFLYLNQVGLPDFIKDPLLEKLRVRGVELRFSRLRLRWYEGIVAENVRFGRTADPFTPELSLREVKVSLDYKALARLKFQVDSLILRRGRLVVPIEETNGPARQLSIENIQTTLRLLPDDQWALDHFTAGFAGARIRLSGTVTHASSVREWKFFSTQKPLPRGALQNRFRQLADTLERIHFSTPPDLNLELHGDAREPQSFTIRLSVSAPDAEMPWGTLSRGHFHARLYPASSNMVSHAELRLEAEGARTTWGNTSDLQLRIRLAAIETDPNLVDGKLILSTRTVETKWGNATNTQFNAGWIHSLTNPVPLSGRGQFSCEGLETALLDGVKAQNIEVVARLSEGKSVSQSGPHWGWWTNIEPYALDWGCRIGAVQSEKLVAESLAVQGKWRAPQLTITNLDAKLYQGELKASAKLDVSDRELNASLQTDFDPHKISRLLTEGGQRWLDQFSWVQSPRVNGNIGLILPAWTNRHPDWRAEVQPKLRIEGEFSAKKGGAYREIPVASAHSHFSYSNMVWLLPDLTVTRAEGQVLAFHQANDRTKDFYWRIKSSIDPKIVRPLFETNLHQHFNLLNLTQPPDLSGEIWGRFHEPELLVFKGALSVTNFTFRGEKIGRLQTSVQYSNHFLVLTAAQAQYGTQHVSAETVAFNMRAQTIYLSNGFSTADPMVVARAIGPKIASTIEPYHFDLPPTARVYGIIPTHNESDADLHFEIQGGPFHWSKFNVAHVAGHVHWKADRLALENVRADFYNGNANGSATFDFSPKQRTDFQFNLAVTNAILQFLMSDISPHTNNLEGRLSGILIVNQANSTNWQSWQGGGQATLKNGLLWEIPAFGVFSPVLNALVPGLGNSPATEGNGTFIITNGVVRTDDLVIRSPAMRLQYRGTVDFENRINARVEAEMLRDMWLVGPLVSTVLWPVTKLFEYKLSGSLSQPKMEQAFLISKFMLMPFHPFKTLKEFLPEDTAPAHPRTPP